MRPHLKSLLILTAMLAAQAGLPAYAHSDEHLDTIATPHGGQQRMAGPLHLELVIADDGRQAKARPITVYVADHADKPLATAGASASITVQTGKTKVRTTLKPDGENRLNGKAVFALSPATKAVVTVTMPGQPAKQARFTPLAEPDEHASHSH
jgi:hypothetical protein